MFIGALSRLARLVVDRRFPEHNSYSVEIPQIGKDGNPVKKSRLLLQRKREGFECRLIEQLPSFRGIAQEVRTTYSLDPQKEGGNSLTDRQTILCQTLPDGSEHKVKLGGWFDILPLLFRRETFADIEERNLNRGLELMATEEERAKANRQ